MMLCMNVMSVQGWRGCACQGEQVGGKGTGMCTCWCANGMGETLCARVGGCSKPAAARHMIFRLSCGTTARRVTPSMATTILLISASIELIQARRPPKYTRDAMKSRVENENCVPTRSAPTLIMYALHRPAPIQG